MFGPLVNGPNTNEVRNVQISDPTNGSMVMLDLQGRTAHRLPGLPKIVLRNKIAGSTGNAAVNVERFDSGETIRLEKFEAAVPARGAALFMFNAWKLIVPSYRTPVVDRWALSSWKDRRRGHTHDNDDSLGIRQ